MALLFTQQTCTLTGSVSFTYASVAYIEMVMTVVGRAQLIGTASNKRVMHGGMFSIHSSGGTYGSQVSWFGYPPFQNNYLPLQGAGNAGVGGDRVFWDIPIGTTWTLRAWS